MKIVFFLITLNLIVFLSTHSFAEETPSEKAMSRSNDSVRAVKKGANRVKEAFCMEGDVKCAAKKVGNRAVEVKDAVVDGAVEVKEKLD